jgi:type I restriction enzyme R subunit
MTFTEESLEHAVLELFAAVEIPHTRGEAVHKEVSEVLLLDDLRQFLLQNYARHDITPGEIQSIIRELQVLPSSALYESNLAFIRKLADGFPLKREDKNKKDLFIQLIDCERPENNRFKIVNQLEIQGTEKRIPDAIVYINGLPLVVWEFKSAVKENTTLRDAYTQLTVRYRRDIPELLKYNAFCVISDGVNNKMGSLFAPYDFFYAWRKINPDDAPKDGINSLYSMVHGVFDKARLVEVIRNFIYFPDTSKEDIKIVCRYPQFYAANKLYASIRQNMKPSGSGKGGTYFGATGCGKSYTMLYLTRLLMKSREMASPTIVLITDRTDLDDQLSGQFTNSKKFIGDEVVETVASRDDLKAKLQGRKSGGVFLSTIHKFTEKADLLTDRSNVVCISDEAHRSQINLDQKIKITDTGVERKFGFARHMHNSLPNATFVGFTGTPIDATLDVFGEVVDAYTMKESVDDEITVRIVYEGRAAKVLLNDVKLKEIEQYYEDCVREGASEYQVDESKQNITRMETILGDPKRIKLVAEDFVNHYETRIKEKASVLGKVMFVTSSREIAWALYLAIIDIRPGWALILDGDEGLELTEEEKREIKPMEKIKMVMTRDKDDPKPLYDILGTKESRKELDRQFKEARSNFKIAIVVDMWLTGFDVPFLDTIYIDKPIQLHSLIQTISRVNRVYEGKEMGLVVDYIGIKSNLNLALAKYSKTAQNDFEDIEKAITLVKDQVDLLNRLFHGFDSRPFFEGTPGQQLECLNLGTEFVQTTEEREKRFVGLVKKLRSAYNLCCSSEEISEAEKDRIHFYFAIKAILHKLTKGDAPDSSQMTDRVRAMIAEALIADGVEEIFKLDKNDPKGNVDIFGDEYMAKIEKIKLPNTKIKLLQKLLNQAIAEFKKVNRLKGVDFSEKMKKLVDTYNERKDFQAFQSDVLDDVAESFANLFEELRTERNSFLELGIGFEEKAFYDILKAVAHKYNFDYPEEKLLKLCKDVKALVDDKAKYTDWANRADIKAELKVDLILILAENGYPPVPQDEVFKEIFQQAEGFRSYRK